jgi:hypothetical protein
LNILPQKAQSDLETFEEEEMLVADALWGDGMVTACHVIGCLALRAELVLPPFIASDVVIIDP